MYKAVPRTQIYRPKLSLPGSIFRFPLPVNDFIKFRLNILNHTNGSLWFFLNNNLVVFNIEGEIIAVQIYITLIKQEKFVIILVILYIREYLYMCFYKIVYVYPGIWRFPISVIWSPK